MISGLKTDPIYHSIYLCMTAAGKCSVITKIHQHMNYHET